MIENFTSTTTDLGVSVGMPTYTYTCAAAVENQGKGITLPKRPHRFAADKSNALRLAPWGCL